MKKLLLNIGRFSSYLFPCKFHKLCKKVYKLLYSGWIGGRFNTFGMNSIVCPYFERLEGAKYIDIGDNVTIDKNVTLTAWDSYGENKYRPHIMIKDNVGVGSNAHITCIDSIIIGNGVLMGKNVLISDNSHGSWGLNEIQIQPAQRLLTVKGPVIIGDNVWICENSCILSGVQIGEGSIVGANSVVTKDIPPYCIVAGVPAKIIKTLR